MYVVGVGASQHPTQRDNKRAMGMGTTRAPVLPYVRNMPHVGTVFLHPPITRTGEYTVTYIHISSRWHGLACS